MSYIIPLLVLLSSIFSYPIIADADLLDLIHTRTFPGYVSWAHAQYTVFLVP